MPCATSRPTASAARMLSNRQNSNRIPIFSSHSDGHNRNSKNERLRQHLCDRAPMLPKSNWPVATSQGGQTFAFAHRDGTGTKSDAMVRGEHNPGATSRSRIIHTWPGARLRPATGWQRHVVGGGVLEPTGSTLRFLLPGATRRQYANAQIDDYQGLPRSRFPWRPPLRLTVRARFFSRASSTASTSSGIAGHQPVLAFGTTPFS